MVLQVVGGGFGRGEECSIDSISVLLRISFLRRETLFDIKIVFKLTLPFIFKAEIFVDVFENSIVSSLEDRAE